jgi:hypothetical protein
MVRSRVVHRSLLSRMFWNLLFASFFESWGQFLSEHFLVLRDDFHNHAARCLCVRLAVGKDEFERNTCHGPDRTKIFIVPLFPSKMKLRVSCELL